MAEEELEIHEQKGNHILHIRGDSDSDLETLFKSVMNPSDTQMPLTVPMRLRKLPKSFFKPPETGSKTPPQPQQTPVSRSRDTGVDSAHDTVLHPGLPPSTPLQIHHPRARSSPASLQQSLIASEPPAQQHHVRQQSYDLSDNVPLPPGWASAKTLGGQRYFLNHISQTTTWEDPRKKLRNSAMNLHSTPSSTPNAPINPLPQSLNLGSLPDEWEQATTPEGEIYFINHHTKTTSWFDPRIPLQLQRTALSNAQIHSQQAIAQLATPASPEAPTTNQINTQQRQQRARIQCLQMEGERLKLRQQEIMRQLKPQQNINNVGIPNYNEMLIRQTISEGIASSPMADLPPVSTGMDPFLGGREIHSRQESSDSGIGMEANYNLVQTPEDFLNRMDENMDTVNENCNSTTDQQQISNDLCNLDIQSQDMTALESGNMDTDELEPSLQEDLTSDILNDVEALLINNRMDTMLTWL